MSPVTTTPSKAPKSRGRIMDFTPRKPLITPKPQAPKSQPPKPVIKMPAPQPQSAPKPTPKPALRPAPRPRPVASAPRVVSHPPIRKRPLSQPAPRPVSRPAPQPAPEPRPAPKPAPQPAPEPKPQPAPLGARSPFLKNSVVVEKRPLSGGAATSTRSHTSRHQAVADYPHPHQLARSSAIKPVSRKSKLPLVLLIIGTLLVGAAVGACAYFLVFQGE